MTPLQPYLIRAQIAWAKANQVQLHAIVDTTVAGVELPARIIAQRQVVLNLDEEEVSNLLINHEHMRFSTCFGGISTHVLLPLQSIVEFCVKKSHVKPKALAPTAETQPIAAKDRRAHLRLVK